MKRRLLAIALCLLTVVAVTGVSFGARNFPASGASYINLGDISTARFDIGTAWTLLAFFRVEDITGDDRGIAAKWSTGAKRQMLLRVSTAGTVQLYHDTSLQITSDTNPSLNTWYLVAIACDGVLDPNADFSMWIYDMTGTSLLTVTPNTGSDSTNDSDLTETVKIGVVNPASTDEFDGDIAHVAYIDREFSSQDVLNYLFAPANVVAQEIGNSGVQFYLPLGLGSPEPDFSGQGNAGTVAGSPTIGNNPPTGAWYGYSHGWLGITSAGAPPPTRRIFPVQ